MPQADQGSADCSSLVVVHVAGDIWLVVDKMQDIALKDNGLKVTNNRCGKHLAVPKIYISQNFSKISVFHHLKYFLENYAVSGSCLLARACRKDI